MFNSPDYRIYLEKKAVMTGASASQNIPLITDYLKHNYTVVHQQSTG